MGTEDEKIEQELEVAANELESAVKRWLSVKARMSDDETDERAVVDDAIIQGWVLVACYTSIELERMEATATAYACADGQAAPFSRGLSLAGVDRWRQSA